MAEYIKHQKAEIAEIAWFFVPERKMESDRRSFRGYHEVGVDLRSPGRDRLISQTSTLSSSSGEMMLSSSSSWNASHSGSYGDHVNMASVRHRVPQVPLKFVTSIKPIDPAPLSKDGYRWLLRQSKRRQLVNPSQPDNNDPPLVANHSSRSVHSDSSMVILAEEHNVDPFIEAAIRAEDSRTQVKAETVRKAMQCKHNLESMYLKHQTRRYERMRRQKELEDEMDRQQLQESQRQHLRALLCQKESDFQRLSRVQLSPTQFSHVCTIGSGAFGEVTLVKNKENHMQYAMKRLDKLDIIRRNHVRLVQAEKEFLCRADSEWVVKLYYSLQDAKSLFLVMEYLPGGDLLGLMSRSPRFPEDIAKFYLLEIIMGVKTIHDMGIIHRDLKGENILIGADGHLKITDFGLCCSVASCEKWDGSKGSSHSSDVVGTPSFVAPEVLLRQPYSRKCDWWSVGVLAFQMMHGSQPFTGTTSRRTCYKVAHWWNFLDIPDHLSLGARSLVAGLICDQDTRMGFSTLQEHMFFKGLSWDRRNHPPFVPGKPHPSSVFPLAILENHRTKTNHLTENGSSVKNLFVGMNGDGFGTVARMLDTTPRWPLHHPQT